MSQLPTLAAQPIVEGLRLGTRAAHASIQTVPILHRLLAPDLTRAEYIWVLLRLHAFRAAIEPSLGLHLRGLAGTDLLLDGAVSGALEDDIAWFGEAPLALPSLFAPDCVASALGCLYVLEGSNLGGRVIGRHVSVALGVGPGTGGSFYCGLSAQDARRRWQVLLDLLQAETDSNDAAHEPIIRGALKTFEALEEWMQDG